MTGREVPRHPDVALDGVEPLHSGRVFDVARARFTLPSGLRQDVDLVLHSGASAVLALDDGGRLLCVRQYRAPAGDWVLEIPAGRLEPDEDPLVAARRELEEETGHRAETWSLLRTYYPALGFCSEEMHLYLARDLEPVPGGGLAADDDEELQIEWATPAELLASTPADSKSIIAAFEALRILGE